MTVIAFPSRSQWLGLARAILAVPLAVAGGWLGLQLGEALAYAIAALTDRDIAELKDMLIWSYLAGGAVCAVASVWLMLWLTRAGRLWQRMALIALGIVAIQGAAMMLISFDWPKSSGRPVVEYQLRLPASAYLPERGNVDITLWSEKSGSGIYIHEIRQSGGRPEIAGSFFIPGASPERTLSLRLNRSSEGHWRFPIREDSKLDKAFGPWQRIEFVPSPRAGTTPLPPGEYEIRYRVRKYM